MSNTNMKNISTLHRDGNHQQNRTYYPDWRILPDPSITASDYWKFVLKEFNQEFAEEYAAEPADLPDDWRRITKEQALRNLQEAFNMK